MARMMRRNWILGRLTTRYDRDEFKGRTRETREWKAETVEELETRQPE